MATLRSLVLGLGAVAAVSTTTSVAAIATVVTGCVSLYQNIKINNLKDKLIFKDGVSSKEIPSETGTYFNLPRNNRVLQKVQRVSDSADLSKVHRNWTPLQVSHELNALRRP